MRIGILGAGHIGATTARLFARAGHEVALSNSRGPASLEGLVAQGLARARRRAREDRHRRHECLHYHRRRR